MAGIELDSVIGRGRDHVETGMSGQTVMMSIARGRYYALGGTGQRVWECLAEPMRVREIVDRLVQEYDVGRATCEADLLAFLGELLAQGLVVEHGR